MGLDIRSDLLSCSSRVVDLIGLDLSHYTHSRHDQFDARGRVLHGLNDGDIGRLQSIECSQGCLQSRYGFSQITLALATIKSTYESGS